MIDYVNKIIIGEIFDYPVNIYYSPNKPWTIMGCHFKQGLTVILKIKYICC